MKNIINANRKLLMLIASILLVTSFIACEDDSNNIIVKGRVEAVLSPCDGNIILVSVLNHDGIGGNGVIFINIDEPIHYSNGIGLPVDSFEKTRFSIGDEIKFECRERRVNDEYLFMHSEPCDAMRGYPNIPYYVVTKEIR